MGNVSTEAMECALHFTGLMRDYFHVKWKESSGLTDEEIRNIMTKELSPEHAAQDYLRARGELRPGMFKDLEDGVAISIFPKSPGER